MTPPRSIVDIEVGPGMWERIHEVFGLVLVATTDPDGQPDVAPKHLAMPMSWQNHFGFVCAPHHATYRNLLATGVFTVNFPRPQMLLQTSLAAAPRASDGSKPTLQMLDTEPASAVDGVVVRGCRLWLECTLREVVEDLADNALVIGEVVAARAPAGSLRGLDVDDQDLLAADPLLAYIHPGRITTISSTQAFPYHAGFSR